MSAAAKIIRDLSERGIRLSPAGEYIRVKPAELLTDDDRERIRTCKPDLLALLSPQDQRPPDDPLSNEVRWRLLLWGGPLGWPSLVQVGLGAGGEAWTEWLLAASIDDLKQTILAAVRAEHTTLALDMEALKLWPDAGILREGQWTES